MEFQTLTLSSQEAIWTLKIKRPEALNALNAQVLADLEQAIGHLAKQDFSNCRLLIISGEGEKAFVAGADIKEIHSIKQKHQAQDFASRGQQVFRSLEQLQVPVMAVVNGFALGGGLELALACDFIIASDKAKFGLPEVGLGLIPGFGGTVRLARVIGLNRARELIFTGEMFSADQAFNLGLVSRVIKPEELASESLKFAQRIQKLGPLAVAAAKKGILQAFDQDLDSALKTEAELFGGLFEFSDTQEGTLAFLEKRPAHFKGR